MRVHVNGRDIVTPDGFSLVTCHNTLTYNQKTEIKPKILTVINRRDTKKLLTPSFLFLFCFLLLLFFCFLFFQVSFELGSSQGYTAKV